MFALSQDLCVGQETVGMYYSDDDPTPEAYLG